MKAYLGGGCIAPDFLDLASSWRSVVSFTTWPLYPRGKSSRYPFDGNCKKVWWKKNRRYTERQTNREWIFKIYSKEKCGIIPKLKTKRGNHGELFATFLYH
jgi:hypothetical protein